VGEDVGEQSITFVGFDAPSVDGREGFDIARFSADVMNAVAE